MDNHKKVNNEADIQANIHAERHAEIQADSQKEIQADIWFRFIIEFCYGDALCL